MYHKILFYTCNDNEATTLCSNIVAHEVTEHWVRDGSLLLPNTPIYCGNPLCEECAYILTKDQPICIDCAREMVRIQQILREVEDESK